MNAPEIQDNVAKFNAQVLKDNLPHMDEKDLRDALESRPPELLHVTLCVCSVETSEYIDLVAQVCTVAFHV